MKKQSIESQRGEVEFRKKLYRQQIEKHVIFHDEFDAEGIESILVGRMEKTRDRMIQLKKNFSLSPYIEIGAERCQRSLVMENDLGLNGAAVDISFDMLKSCSYYQKVFDRKKSPLRICCDANNLPFMSNSIPFVFCYETLHHFPDPSPIIREIYRVLSPGSIFFFDEEPYKQVFHFNLYEEKNKIYSKESLKNSKLKKIFSRFFCAKTCNEVEHGIIENLDLSLKLWKKSLVDFDTKDIVLTPTRFFKTELFNPSSWLKYFVAYLLGGEISGLCRKSGDNRYRYEKICETLACPSCRELGNDVQLMQENLYFVCTKCSKKYPVVDNVLFLLTYDKFSELYPDIFESFQSQ